MTATMPPQADNAASTDQPVDDPRPTLTKELADAEKRLATAIAARDARATELAQARSDAAAAQTSFEDGIGTPAAAAQARALADVLAAALAKNEAAVSSATSARDVAAQYLTRAQDLVEAERLAGEIATGLAAMKELRREVVSAFRDGVIQFRDLQEQTGAVQQQFVDTLKRLYPGAEGHTDSKAALKFVQQLAKRGVDTSAVYLRIDPNTSNWLNIGQVKEPKVWYDAMDGWEREFDRQIGRS